MAVSQAGRLISIDTPLGKDVLLVRSVAASEALSSLFNISVELLSEEKAIKLDDLVGRNVTIRVLLGDESERFFNGHVSRFSRVGADLLFASYRAEIVPWLWFLTRTAKSRIFQDLSVPDIIQKIFSDMGFSDFKLSLTGDYTTWDYCVQYRETDFNFVSRLMEEEGIFYFFEHENGKHTLVLADASAAHKPCENQATARFDPEPDTGQREDVVTAWQTSQEVKPGSYTLRDFHHEMPSQNLEVAEKSTVAGAEKKFEIYDYPGEYAPRFVKTGERLPDVNPEGRKIVKVRMEEQEAFHLFVTGASSCRAFTTGTKFDLREHFDEGTNGTYVLAALRHSMTQGSGFVSGEEADWNYSNGFTCIPLAATYRPPRVTPKPVVQGPQTAVVVGPSGEEIFTDKYGRVKVQFHWDREGKRDEKSSCWIRVASPWAGKNFGAISLPRIGQEVVVVFLEGDPDQPLITGRVYNADQMPPYALPDEQTKSTIKTRSSKDGAVTNFNEIRFEDKKGGEQLFVHAEMDRDDRVKRDEREWIGRDRHLIVKHIQKELVEGDKHLHVKMTHMEKIDGKMSLSVGGDRHAKIGMVDTAEAGTEIHLKAGVKVIIEAGAQISLVGPGGFIDIGPAGVAIQGTMVMINSGGAAGSGTPASPAAPEDPDIADDGTKTGKF